MSRREVVTALLRQVEQEHHEAGGRAFTWLKMVDGHFGCPLIDFGWLEHVDRIFAPRLDRLRRLTAEARGRERTELRIAGMWRMP